MKSGTSNSLPKVSSPENKKQAPPRNLATRVYHNAEEMDEFQDVVAQPQYAETDYDGVPWVFAPRSLIEFYVRGEDLANFDKVGFFMYHSVRVYEVGKKLGRPEDKVTP